jgi:hypothetical protein
MPKMSRLKYLKGECAHCGGPIGFPADSIGTTANCPHCGQPTELMLARPKEEPSVPRKTLIWTVVTVLLLGLGLIGAIVALRIAEKRVPPKPEQAAETGSVPATNSSADPDPNNPVVKAGFRVSAISLEKAQGSSLIYAIGTLTNAANRQRFGVKLELDLLDDAGQKVGSARDYGQTLELHGEWQFKALVVESKAKSAKVASISEQQ